MKKIVYSPGEPSGIGPDIIIQLCRTAFWTDIKIPILCISDPKLLDKRAADLRKKITLQKISDIDELKTKTKTKKNIVNVLAENDYEDRELSDLDLSI